MEIITDRALFEALTAEIKASNYNSHEYGPVDDCTRCIHCEIGEWNGWKEACSEPLPFIREKYYGGGIDRLP